MYSSSNSFTNPLPYTNQTTVSTSFFDTYQNPSSIQDYPSSSPPFLNFPVSTFLDDGDLLLSDFVTQQQQQILGFNDISLAAETNSQENHMNLAASKKATTRTNKKIKRSSSTASSQQPISRKRSGKKDRHSKIYTAQGPRDRRMRLSLQIARKFFDLQDMLGFDKASKTIDWLFTKSKAAIKELTDSYPKVKRSSDSDGSSRSVSSTSESEVMSGTKLTTEDNGDKRGMGTEGDSFVRQQRCKESNNNKPNKPVFNLLARESRDKARARARERTKEKLKHRCLDKSKHCCSQSNPDILELLLPSGTLENGEKQEMKSAVKTVSDQEGEKEKAEDQEPGTILGLTNSTVSFSFFDISQDAVIPSGPDFEDHEFSGFPGNWDIISNGSNNNRYYSMPNMKLSATGNAHVQNPNAIFMATPNSQEQNLTSVFMATSDTQNPNSGFHELFKFK
ncbi:transcription factor TCP12 [Ricinus communis]|uniref:Transcription factor n=1 Tax=Ricinus communis TaxID=3988 RepID=B9SEI1_RICCO|nr:transcription factor TCP12 [Ricinus communis]EEF38011.1 conserved hypothetical protein [Ricinus communis]